MSEEKFLPYLNDRLIKKSKYGFFVIKPANFETKVPLACDVCSFLLRTQDDEKAYIELGCCNWCALTFAYPNKNKWLDGWRPSSQELESALNVRPNLSIKIDLE